ncbi:MAG TPA: hypothetical protein VK465_13620, partial [Fibrobacteria bacterium]|nr:hypothetical protein [Fibrobacteria bacterium]
MRWFRAAARTLPWRTDQNAWGLSLLEEPRPAAASSSFPAEGKDPEPPPRRDPYHTWIAEVMLQQTQVATVLEHYRRWMECFPDVETLAAAREEDVLARWAGLGYYSRARNILATARQVVSAHGGRFPRGREGLLGLKGIGEYTAGAIASLAFDLPEPILDGNLVRVFSRLHGLAFLPDSAARRQVYWDLARRWVEAQVDES